MIKELNDIIASTDIEDAAKVEQVRRVLARFVSHDELIAILKGAMGKHPTEECPTDPYVDFDHGGHSAAHSLEWKGVYTLRPMGDPKGPSKPTTIVEAAASFGVAKAYQTFYELGDTLQPHTDVVVGGKHATTLRKPNHFQWWVQLTDSQEYKLVERREITIV